jgi:hypothetical protein
MVFILPQSDHESLVHPERHYTGLNLTYVIYSFKRNLIIKGETLEGIIQCQAIPFSDICCAHLTLATNDFLHWLEKCTPI